MNRFPFPWIALLVVGLVVGCGDDAVTPDPAADENPPAASGDPLVGSWTHSSEEEPAGSTAEWFRPSMSRDWAEAWFRMRFDFREDGTCDYLWLSPVDAHEMRPGTWERDPKDDRVVRVYDENGDLIERVSFFILDLQDDLLRIETLDAR